MYRCNGVNTPDAEGIGWTMWIIGTFTLQYARVGSRMEGNFGAAKIWRNLRSTKIRQIFTHL